MRYGPVLEVVKNVNLGQQKKSQGLKSVGLILWRPQVSVQNVIAITLVFFRIHKYGSMTIHSARTAIIWEMQIYGRISFPRTFFFFDTSRFIFHQRIAFRNEFVMVSG